MRSSDEGWLPINGSPIGLVTWYAPAGPVAMLASWLAIINDRPPELRAGCCGRAPGRQALPAAADFTVNIPAAPLLPALERLFARAAAGSVVAIDDAVPLAPAQVARAPLLAGCVLRIECARGRLAAAGWDAELIGEIVLLHRGDQLISPANSPDFCALQPLRTCLSC